MKSYNIFLLIIYAIFLASGCNDFLDKVPNDSPTRDAFWEKKADLITGTTGAYWYFRQVFMYGAANLPNDKFMAYGDQPTGLFTNDSRINLHTLRGEFHYCRFSLQNLTFYTDYYPLINTANLVITKATEIPLTEFSSEEERNIYVGEALFIRAFTYFFMVRLWGEVPYVTYPYSDAAEIVRDIELSTEEDILGYCLADLEKAYSYLSWKDTHGYKASRANRGAVLALKAHILMWQNRNNKSTIDPANYRKAIETIDEIEREGGYTLVGMENYQDIWKGGGKSKESIFEFPFDRANGEKFDKWSFFSRVLGYDDNPDAEIEPILKYNPGFLNIISKYNEYDQRMSLWKRWGDMTHQYTTKYHSLTFLNDQKTDWEVDNTFVLFRLSDLLLLRAEAHEELGEYEQARTYLGYIQQRASIPAEVTASIPASQLSDEISDERVRELYLEGHNLYDWIRTGHYSSKNYHGAYSVERYMGEGYLWPVHQDVLLDNFYARQTPYWADKLY